MLTKKPEVTPAVENVPPDRDLQTVALVLEGIPVKQSSVKSKTESISAFFFLVDLVLSYLCYVMSLHVVCSNVLTFKINKSYILKKSREKEQFFLIISKEILDKRLFGTG